MPWYRDYCEESSLFTIDAIDSVNETITVTLSLAVDYDSYMPGVGLGWKFQIGDTIDGGPGSRQYLVIAATDNGGTYTLTLNRFDFTGADVSATTLKMYRPVEWTAEWSPISGGNPFDLKQFVDVMVKAETCNTYAIDFSYANQTDTKAAPYDDDWEDQPPRDRVYVPASSGARASAASNDFGAIVGSPVPFNEIRSIVHPQRAMGEHLSVRLSGGTAEGYVALKALVVQVATKESNRGRP